MTKEEIAQAYKAAMDSVNLINQMIADGLTVEQEDRDTISRNVEHLKIMVGKDFWMTEDLTPIKQAITEGEKI